MVGVQVAVGLITAFALIQGASSVILNSLVREIEGRLRSWAHLAIGISFLFGLIGLGCVAGSILSQVKILDFGISGAGPSEPLPSLSFDWYLFVGTVFLFGGVAFSWLAGLACSVRIARMEW